MFVWHIISIACALVWPALFCYFGSHTSEQVKNLGNIAYESNWYEYPQEIRKHLVMIIARSQAKTLFNGLYFIGCSMEVFGIVSIYFNHFSRIAVFKCVNLAFLLAFQIFV